MVEEFLKLAEKHKTRVTQHITNAEFVRLGGGDWREEFRTSSLRSAGGLRKIYRDLYEIRELDFETLVRIMTEDDTNRTFQKNRARAGLSEGRVPHATSQGRPGTRPVKGVVLEQSSDLQ